MRLSRKAVALNGLRRSVSVEPRPRARLTSSGVGIRVFRYLARGVMSWVVLEQKCLLRLRDAASPKKEKAQSVRSLMQGVATPTITIRALARDFELLKEDTILRHVPFMSFGPPTRRRTSRSTQGGTTTS